MHGLTFVEGGILTPLHKCGYTCGLPEQSTRGQGGDEATLRLSSWHRATVFYTPAHISLYTNFLVL